MLGLKHDLQTPTDITSLKEFEVIDHKAEKAGFRHLTEGFNYYLTNCGLGAKK